MFSSIIVVAAMKPDVCRRSGPAIGHCTSNPGPQSEPMTPNFCGKQNDSKEVATCSCKDAAGTN